MRRDARERREALIVAAAECFGRSGYLVPLEDVADRAGVGRGTLYRNFKDRMALAIAIFDRELDLIEADMDRLMPIEDIIVDLATRSMRPLTLFTRIAADMPLNDGNRTQFEALGIRFAALLQPMVARAHAEGTLRTGISAADIVVIIRMIGGLLRPFFSAEEMRVVAAHALGLVRDGLRPPP